MNKIAKSTLEVTFVLIFVKFIGIIKQATIVAYYGATIETDRYLIASEFVGQVGVLFFSALSVSFLAMYVQTKNQNGEDQANQFASNVFLVFVPAALGVTIVVFLFSDKFSYILAPGYDKESRAVVSGYIRTLSVIIINACTTNICTGILEGNKIFFPVKFCGLFQSVCMIMACIFFSHRIGIRALLIAYMVYFIIENIYLLCMVIKCTGFQLQRKTYDPHIYKLVKLCVPSFISNAIVEINHIADKAIASGLAAGNVSSLSYSNYLFNSIYAIITGSFCSVCFSYFATYVSKGENDQVGKLLFSGIRYLVMLLAFIAVITILYAEEIITIIYGRGKFDSTAIDMTVSALKGYAAGILFIAVRDMIIRAHYAFQDMKRPMLNASFGMVSNLGLSIVFAKRWGLFGISLASSVSYMLVTVLSFFTLKRHIKISGFRQEIIFYLKVFVSADICFFLGNHIKMCIFASNLLAELIIRSALLGITYLVALILLNCDELYKIMQVIRIRKEDKTDDS